MIACPQSRDNTRHSANLVTGNQAHSWKTLHKHNKQSGI
jgi:hypothetical protein